MPFDATAYALKQKAKKEKAARLRADRAARSGQLKREAAERAAERLSSQKKLGLVDSSTASDDVAAAAAAAAPSAVTASASASSSAPAVPDAVARRMMPAAATTTTGAASAMEERVRALEGLVGGLSKRVVEAEAESERLRYDVTALRDCCKRQGKLLKRLNQSVGGATPSTRKGAKAAAATATPRTKQQKQVKRAPKAAFTTSPTVAKKASPPKASPPKATAAAPLSPPLPKAAATAAAAAAAALSSSPPINAAIRTFNALDERLEREERPLNAASERPLAEMSNSAPPPFALEEFAEVTTCPCKKCGRSFREAALLKHERICAKLQKKRPVVKTQYVDLAANGAENSYESKYGRRGRKNKKRAGKQAKPKPKSKWKEQSGALRAAMASCREYAAEKAAADALPKKPQFQQPKMSTSSNSGGGFGVAARPSRRSRAAR